MNFFRECFYSNLTLNELRARMQTIADACDCHASKQSDSRDRGLISSLPIFYCTNSFLYVDFIIAAYLSPVACPASLVCFLATRK